MGTEEEVSGFFLGLVLLVVLVVVFSEEKDQRDLDLVEPSYLGIPEYLKAEDVAETLQSGGEIRITVCDRSEIIGCEGVFRDLHERTLKEIGRPSTLRAVEATAEDSTSSLYASWEYGGYRIILSYHLKPHPYDYRRSEERVEIRVIP